MALVFVEKPTATLKGKSSAGDNITLLGVTSASITPSRAASQANKILDIVGINLVVDLNMSITQVKEVVEE